MNAAQVVMARLDDVEEAMGGLSMRCRQYDNVLKMVGELQQQVERLEGERNSKVDTIQHHQQIIRSKEQEVQALKDELATVHRLRKEG